MLTALIIAGVVLAIVVILIFIFNASGGGEVMSISEEMAVHNTKAQEYGKVLGGGCGCGPKGTKRAQ